MKLGPTQAQLDRDEYVTVTIPALKGKTKRAEKVRQLERITRARLVDLDHVRSLRHYRAHADLIDRSPIRDSTNIEQGGGNGGGVSFELTHAKHEAQRIEAVCGLLAGLLKTVVVADKSLSEYAVDRYGAREDCRNVEGVRVCRIKPHKRHLEAVKDDFRTVARLVHGAIVHP